MNKLLTLIVLTAGLAAAQTTTTYTALTQKCNNLAGCSAEPFSHYPVGWAYVSYLTGLEYFTEGETFSGESISMLLGDGWGHDTTYNFANLAGTLTGPGTADGAGMWRITATFSSGDGSITGFLIRNLYRHQVKMGRGPLVWQVVDFGGAMTLTTP